MNNDSSSRIVERLSAWIAGAAPGARLPSTRSLVTEFQASPVTVQKALQTLTARGLVESRPGVGTFVRAVRTARPADYGWQTAALRASQGPRRTAVTALRDAPNHVIAFHSGYPDRELLPERLVRTALARAARSDAAISRPPASGLPELQSWFAQGLAASTPAGVTPPTPADVVVLPGSQSGLSSIFRALPGNGQPVLMESPTYWGAILAAAQVGVPVVPVPSGPDGPDPAELARAFEESGSRLFYAQPNYANPTGAQWSADRRREILDVARQYGAFIVEDDWAHDFGITTSPVPLAGMDDSGHVVYLRSLTKSVSPAIRVAAVIARGPARERLQADRAAESMYVSGLLQAAALDVVTQPGWQAHLRSLRHQLQSRRDFLVVSLREHAPEVHITRVPEGGLNLWVRLPDAVDPVRLGADCEREGVMIAAGAEWFPAEPAGPYLRLNYAGPNPAGFGEGARIIGRCMSTQLTGR
ncbi:PLP-dependent aminotransferase family protein [Pseudarthrobacter sp. J75]|uniref:aminotransferase-like domain-containing protein n=1 Tax=unclassified Pseudarthrobacter TaxID=2647000 RepID=UPI002E822B03|nr:MULTISPECIES: PLP-dependent aminotransferase family protein [unclassified Pseudarthrobacter]MEE2522315.1 PLP-dependent aminotransferase family protein [Pseudarthrobacter sp. J47]MEE2528039.1 PLP-dependent aminotransferase family protein [Pseudarthrobacter sp. J75]